MKHLFLGVHVVVKTINLSFGRLYQRLILKYVFHPHGNVLGFLYSKPEFPINVNPVPSLWDPHVLLVWNRFGFVSGPP